MDTQKLLIEIEVDSSQAVQRLVEQKAALEKLKQEKQELQNANKALTEQENVDTAAIQRNKEAIIDKEAKIKNLTAEIRTNEKIVQASTKTTDGETGAYQKLSLQYSVAAQKAKDMAVVHGVNSEEAKKATAAAAAMDRQLKEVDKSVGQNQRSVGNYSGALEEFGGKLGMMPGLLGQVGASITMVGTAMKSLLANPIVLATAAIVGLGTAIVGLVKNGMEFNQEMTKVRAVTQATTEEYKLLKQSAIELGASTMKTASEVATLQLELAKMGFTVPEILDAQAAIIELSQATGEDLAKSAEIAASTVRAFGLNANETQRVVDIMAMSMNKSSLSLDSFGEAMKYVAPNAKAANVSIEDTAAMMAILADNGIKGSMAGTSLRKIMTDLAGTGGDLTQKLSELSKENLNLADASDEVGRNAQTAFIVLLNNMEKLPGLSEEFRKSGGAAEEMSRIMGDTLTGDVDRLGGAWDSFMLSLDDGEGIFSKIGRVMIQWLTEVVEEITRFGKVVGYTFNWVADNFGYVEKAVVGAGQTIKIVFTAISNAWQAFASGDFAGVAKSFDGLGKKIGDAFDMKKITAMKNANIEVREHEKSVRDAANELKNMEAEKVKNADNDKKRNTEASDARKKQLEEARKAQNEEIKLEQNKIAILQAKYKNNYDAEQLMDENYKNSKNKQLTDIYNAEISLNDKKLKYHKFTIEEKKLADMEANKKYLAAQQQLNTDLNAELVKKIDYEMSLESIKDKMKLLNAKLTEDEKYQISIDGINERYKAEKEKIELTISDETDKNRKLEILNQQHNLDIATAEKAHQDLLNKQKLEDEAQLLESKYAMMKDGVEKEYLLKKDALDKEKAERLAKVTAGSEAERAINEEYTAKEIELDRQKNIAKAQAIVEYAKLASEVASSINDFLNALGEREYSNFEKVKNAELDIYTKNAQSQIDVATQKYNEDVALLDEQLANKTISQEEYDAAKKALDKNYADFKEGITSGLSEKEKQIQEELDEKKAELEYEAAKRAKGLAIANAIIGGAAAVIAALATPFAGPALAIAAGITAAAQLAVIIATPIPDNRKGGSSGSSSGSSSNAGGGYTPPNTSNTTTGIVSGNLSKDSGYTTSAAIDKMNTEMSGYVPVLVLSDLTKEQEHIKQIRVTSEL